MNGSNGFFLVFAAITLLSAVAMLTRKHALDGAVCLIVCFLSFAGLYALLDAPFVAVMQVLVYAGAIMMLIIFVIMTVDAQEKHFAVRKPVLAAGIAATAIMAVCLSLFYIALRAVPRSAGAGGGAPSGTVERIGRLLFTNHVLNFEMISLLLLAALVGALVLGKKGRRS
jgi:NADH-quinone oxidoreductase subunit J